MSKKEKGHKIVVMTITTRELKDKLFNLGVIIAGAKPKNNQIIEGAYNDAHFTITKEKHLDCVFYIVRVAGPSKSNRESVTSQFKTLLLDVDPIEFPAQALVDTDSLFWDVNSIKKG